MDVPGYIEDMLEQGLLQRNSPAFHKWMAAHERNLSRNRAQEIKPERREELYKEYLQSDEWQFRREMCLEYYRHRCAICNSHKGLHVHHRTYERIYAELPSDLIVLCNRCHATYHGHMDDIDTHYLNEIPF